MPSIVLNRKVFEKLVGKKLPDDELKDRISMIGTDLEKIDENEIHVEVFPNRPDWLSEQGFARSFSAFIGEKTGLRKYDVKKSGKRVVVDKSVSMRPYTACAIVKNVKFDDEKIREIMQVQEKLAMTHGRNRRKSAYGLYPSKGINFPVKYIAQDPKKIMFRPLGFQRKILAADVEELHPKGREYKDVARGWTKYPFFIDNEDNIMCMLPYTNSEDTGKVDETTEEVFIECTGTGWENVNVALNIITTMLADMGGEIYSIEMVYPDKTVATPDLNPKKMKFDLDYVNKRLGLELKEKEAKELLEKMGFGYETGKGGKGTVLVPAYRADILHPIDLVEDIAVAYGYENFVEEIPNVSTVGEENKFETFKRIISNILTGTGMLEVCTYNLINREIQTTKMCLGKEMDSAVVGLLNPQTIEFDTLRFWMTPCLMDVLNKNKHHEYPQRIFDIGTIFKKNKKSTNTETKTETKITEADRLCVASCHSTADFTEIKQILDYLMQQIGMEYKIEETEHNSFIPGRVARASVKGKDGKQKDVAYIGEIHPQVLENFELNYPVVAFELNLTDLFKIFEEK